MEYFFTTTVETLKSAFVLKGKNYNRLTVSKRRTVHLLSEYFVKPTNHFSKNQKLNNLFGEWNTKFSTDESSLGPPFNYALKHLEHLYRFFLSFKNWKSVFFLISIAIF